jgi:dihydropyrimidinase
MALIYNGGVAEGRIDLNRFVQLTSANAAKLFGMFPKKGTIAVGSDADIVIFNPDGKQTLSISNSITHHMNVDYCTYEGFEVQGYPETVISRGEVVVRNHETVGRKGRGQFIRRKPYSGFVV